MYTKVFVFGRRSPLYAEQCAGRCIAQAAPQLLAPVRAVRLKCMTLRMSALPIARIITTGRESGGIPVRICVLHAATACA